MQEATARMLKLNRIDSSRFLQRLKPVKTSTIVQKVISPSAVEESYQTTRTFLPAKQQLAGHRRVITQLPVQTPTHHKLYNCKSTSSLASQSQSRYGSGQKATRQQNSLSRASKLAQQIAKQQRAKDDCLKTSKLGARESTHSLQLTASTRYHSRALSNEDQHSFVGSSSSAQGNALSSARFCSEFSTPPQALNEKCK